MRSGVGGREGAPALQQGARNASGCTLAVGLAAGLVAVTACGGGVPEPRAVPHAPGDFVDAPSMPPPGKAETLPERPEGAVWVDGGWALVAGRWTWQHGHWVVPPPGAVYARWTVVRLSSGALRYAPGIWKDAQRRPLPPPRPLAFAREAQGDEVLEPQGTPPAPASSGSAPASSGSAPASSGSAPAISGDDAGAEVTP